MIVEVPAARGARQAAAWVDDEPVPLAHVRRRRDLIVATVGRARMPADGSPEDRRLQRWIVQTLADELVLERHARSLGVPHDREVAHPFPDEATVAVFEHVTADVRIDDAQVRDHYERNLGRYRHPERRRVDQVITSQAASAGALAVQAADAGSLRAVAPDAQTHWLVRGAVGGELEERVFGADPPTILTPIGTAAGWHVVEVLESTPASVDALEDVADDIRRDLLAAARGERFDRWLNSERRRRVRYAPGHGHPGDPRLPDSIHRH